MKKETNIPVNTGHLKSKENIIKIYTFFQIEGCENSGLFKAFSQHVLHRLGIHQRPNTDKKIRITFLSRNTKYRNVLNENELISALQNHTNYEVKKV